MQVKPLLPSFKRALDGSLPSFKRALDCSLPSCHVRARQSTAEMQESPVPPALPCWIAYIFRLFRTFVLLWSTNNFWTCCLDLVVKANLFSCNIVKVNVFKGEVRRKMNFTYVLGFVVLRDVVKVFPVSSSSFARKTTGRNRGRSHSGAWRRLKTKWDLKLICLFRVRHISSDTCLSKSEQQLPSSSSTLSSSDSSGAWIFSHFRIQVGSADECVVPGRRQPQETRWTSDGRLSSPETNLKVGRLPLFFMQLLLPHMFLSFMVRTSPLTGGFRFAGLTLLSLTKLVKLRKECLTEY